MKTDKTECEKVFGSSIALPDEYMKLLDAELTLNRKFHCGLNKVNRIDSKTMLKIAVAGDDEAWKAAEFINAFDENSAKTEEKGDAAHGGEEVQKQLSV